MRLKNYSSGMHVRLAFSVAIQVDAEILLIDEVLAVGDARFQQKCFDEFQRLKHDGRTILFVTHDMSAIERFCDRAMLLEKGRMIDIGEPTAIARRYNELNFGRTIHSADRSVRRPPSATATAPPRSSTPGSRTTTGARIAAIAPPRDLHRVHRGPLQRAASTIRSSGRPCATTSARRCSRRPPRSTSARPATSPPARPSIVRLRFETWFTQTRYTLTPSVARSGMGSDTIDLRADLASVVVHGGNWTTGVVDLPHEFDDRAPVSVRAPATRSRSKRSHGARRRLRRRPAAFREPDVDARDHRLQAHLLRLGARVRVVAGAAAAVLHACSTSCSRQIFQVGKGIPDYSVQLLIAIIMWTFFLQATSGCVQCLLGREALLRKMRFPRLVIPLAVALTAALPAGHRTWCRSSCSRSPPGCTPRIVLARDPGAAVRCSRCSRRASACCSRSCSSASATSSRSGTSARRCCSTPRRSSTRSTTTRRAGATASVPAHLRAARARPRC